MDVNPSIFTPKKNFSTVRNNIFSRNTNDLLFYRNLASISQVITTYLHYLLPEMEDMSKRGIEVPKNMVEIVGNCKCLFQSALLII